MASSTEQPSFLAFPSELRNAIYELVLSSVDDMVVRINEAGVADDGPKHKLALTQTCKEIRDETADFAIPETTTIILKPHCIWTALANVRLANLFDLDTWLDTIKGYRFINPKRVILELGLIEVTHIPTTRAWQAEIEAIVNRIPLEGITRADIDFSVLLVLVAAPAGDFDLLIPLEDVHNNDAAKELPKLVRGVTTVAKHEVGSLVAEDWQGMELTREQVAARKVVLWNSLHMGEKALGTTLLKVYHARDRVQKGLGRHPGEGEKRTVWFVHD